MSPTLYVVNWAPYQYLVQAMLRAKPMPALAIADFSTLDHPLAREPRVTGPFVAYRDAQAEAAFTFLAVAEALDRRFPGFSLCGEDATRRGQVRSLCHIVEEGFTLMTASQLKDLPGYDGPMWHASSQAPKAMLETYVKKIGFVERAARGHAFLLGGRPYLPDVILAASCWYAEDLGLPPIPDGNAELAAWHRRNCASGLFERPAARG